MSRKKENYYKAKYYEGKANESSAGGGVMAIFSLILFYGINWLVTPKTGYAMYLGIAFAALYVLVGMFGKRQYNDAADYYRHENDNFNRHIKNL